ncbi:hypothetical protein BGZ65_002813, partial [Modicella reniformis]
DPLARAVRQKLRSMGVESGIDVVYSTEKPHHVKLLPLDETQVQEADEYSALPDFRARILPLTVRENRLDKNVRTIALDRRDVGYILEEIFRGKSVISQSTAKIGLCRWKRAEPLSLQNLVVMTKSEIKKHEKLPLDADLAEVYGRDVVDYVEAKFRKDAEMSRLR